MKKKNKITTREVQKLLIDDVRTKKTAGRGIFNKKGKLGRVNALRFASSPGDKKPSEVGEIDIDSLLGSPTIRNLILEKLGIQEKIFSAGCISNHINTLLHNLRVDMSKLTLRWLEDLKSLKGDVDEVPNDTSIPEEFKIVDVAWIRHMLSKKKNLVPLEDIKLYLFQLAYEMEVGHKKDLRPVSVNKKDELPELRPYLYTSKRLWRNWASFWVEYQEWKKEVNSRGLKNRVLRGD